MLDLRELIVYPHGKKYVVIGGNMRLRAGKELGFETMPCKILKPGTPLEKLKRYAEKDNMAKFDKKKIAQCVEWVEQNGLYPQRCGAPLKDFCSAMGISEPTYRSWLKFSEFSEAIAHARDVFAEQTVVEVVNALKKKALGCEYVEKRVKKAPRKIVTYDLKTGKKIAEEQGELIVVEQSADTVMIMPDTQAAIFLLTNLDSEHWKNMQKVEQSGELKVNAEFKGFSSVLPHYPNIEEVVAEQEQNRPTEE